MLVSICYRFFLMLLLKMLTTLFLLDSVTETDGNLRGGSSYAGGKEAAISNVDIMFCRTHGGRSWQMYPSTIED